MTEFSERAILPFRLSQDEMTHRHDVIIRTSGEIMAGTVFISFQFVSKTFDDVIN